MGRRREEKVDEEELARLESPEDDTSVGRIRVKMPNLKVNEMFALAEQILGGRRVNVLCADGEMRLARIPGKMRRRQWVREGDLIIVWPWDFQDSKADVKHRYTKTQAMYLSRKGVLPDVVDLFGTSFSTITTRMTTSSGTSTKARRSRKRVTTTCLVTTVTTTRGCSPTMMTVCSVTMTTMTTSLEAMTMTMRPNPNPRKKPRQR